MTKLALPQLTAPVSAAQWNDFLLATATKLGISATDWEDGAPTRTTFAVFANALMIQDVDASLIAQSGFIDYAAFGSVTYTDVDGNTVTIKVTPDPSNIVENPTGALGALDVLADAVYDVQRRIKTAAGGVLAILNLAAGTFGPFAAGTYHAAQPGVASAPTYSNTASLTIPPSATVGNVTGTANNAGAVKLTITGHGFMTGDVIAVVGVLGTTAANGTWSVTVNDANHVTLDGSAYAGAYTGGGIAYAPTLAAFTADAAGTASNAAARTIVQAVTSIVGVSVANPAAWVGTDTETNAQVASRCRLKLSALSPGGPTGAYDYFAIVAQDLAPGLTPPLTGRPSQPITKTKTSADRTTGTVTTTIANAAGAPTGGAYPGTGSDDGGDVWAVGAVVQAWAVPWGITSIVQAASPVTVNVAGSVWVPLAQVTAANVVIAAAIGAYFATLPLGGVSDPGGASNVLPIGGIEGAVAAALKAANITAQDIALTLNGLAANVALAVSPTPEVAVLGTMGAAAVGV